jgi:hypothetical protein
MFRTMNFGEIKSCFIKNGLLRINHESRPDNLSMSSLTLPKYIGNPMELFKLYPYRKENIS